MTIRVLVVDDHPLFRYGLRTALADVEDLTVVGEAVDGAEAVKAALELGAHVVLMDLHMPGMSGIEAIQTLTAEAPDIAVLALSMLDNDEALFTALHAGARGYLVKGADREEIIRAIRGSPTATWSSAEGSPIALSLTSPPRPPAAAAPPVRFPNSPIESSRC
jgi:DNA-binding NarL/FixJ family response regulator